MGTNSISSGTETETGIPGKALFELAHRFVHQLFRRFRRGVQPRFVLFSLRSNAGDGEQVFHHSYQPFRVGDNILEQFPALRIIQLIIVFENGIGRPDDCGQRRSEIVRNRSQEICAHALALGLNPNAFRLLDAGCYSAGGQRNEQKAEECHWIAFNS